MNRAIRRQQKKQRRKKGTARLESTARLLSRALVARKRSDHKEAINQAFSLFSKSNSQDSAVVAASAALNMEPMDDAIEAFSRLAIAAPNDAGIQNDYGGLLCKAHRFEEAEKALRRALENSPNDDGTLFNLGHALLGQNLFQDAETVFKQVIKRFSHPFHILKIFF